MKMALAKLQNLVETHVEPRFAPATSATFLLRSFGFLKIPLIYFIKPSVLEISDERIVVRVALNRKTRNHLGSMYFGTLAIGADTAVGLLATHHFRKRRAKLHLSFKDFRADFLKRADGDVHFACEQGKEIAAFVDEVIASGERRNLSVPALAFVPSRHPEPVARFTLTLSLKRKG